VKQRVLFDVTGLIQWYSFLRHPSGLQRFTEKVLQSRPVAAWPEAVLVARAFGADDFVQVPSDLVRELAGPLRASAIGRIRSFFTQTMSFSQPLRMLEETRLIDLPYVLQAALRSKRRDSLHLSGNDVIVGLGDFWCRKGHVAALTRAKHQSGAKLVHMIHDLFALQHRDWTHPYFGAFFRDRFFALAPQVDRWLVNSRFVAQQLGDTLGSPRAPIDIVPMGWDPRRPAHPGTLAQHGLRKDSYYLHVGTLEPRKNLVSLLAAAERAAKIARSAALPLILVGRDGWRSGEIRKQLSAVGDKVARWLPDVSDEELPAFYQGARFSVSMSLAEGWGLPVQESLAQGTPCLCSPVGGVPEAGGALARYVGPDDIDGFAAAIAEWALNPKLAASARDALRTSLALSPRPTWDDAGDQVLKSALSVLS
jgi:glycosyltransferase involved in cell wall biosynthesis